MWLSLSVTWKNSQWEHKGEWKKPHVSEARAVSQVLISPRGMSSQLRICGRASGQPSGFTRLLLCVCSPGPGQWVWKQFPVAVAICSVAASWVLLLGPFPHDGSS